MNGNTFEKLKWPPLLYYNFATNVIDAWASEEKNKVAMLWTDGHKEIELTFKDIAQQSQKFASALAKQGCKKDDIVLLIMGREIQWWIVLTACLRMGAVCSPGTTQLSKDDIAYRVNAAGATCIITDNENAQKVDQVASECPTLKIKIKIGKEKKNWHWDVKTRKKCIQRTRLCLSTVFILRRKGRHHFPVRNLYESLLFLCFLPPFF